MIDPIAHLMSCGADIICECLHFQVIIKVISQNLYSHVCSNFKDKRKVLSLTVKLEKLLKRFWYYQIYNFTDFRWLTTSKPDQLMSADVDD